MRELPDSVEVVVVGFGPVGATIANLLGQYGVRTLVVDRATDILMIPRAIALDNEALRILQLAGLGAGAFDTVAIPFVRMRSPYIGEFAQLNTAGVLDGHPKLASPSINPTWKRCCAGGSESTRMLSPDSGWSWLTSWMKERACGSICAIATGTLPPHMRDT
jgi:3-(3-hydroxy-phenyl)propionate hydroxylase